MTGARERLLSARAPDVGHADVMIVGNPHRGNVADDLAKIATEFEPIGIVLWSYT